MQSKYSRVTRQDGLVSAAPVSVLLVVVIQTELDETPGVVVQDVDHTSPGLASIALTYPHRILSRVVL